MPPESSYLKVSPMIHNMRPPGLNLVDIRGFPVPNSIFSDQHLRFLANDYLESVVDNSTMLVRQHKQTWRAETQAFKIQNSKPIIDEIDRVLAKRHGFTDEELDFISNYDIKYHMWRER